MESTSLHGAGLIPLTRLLRPPLPGWQLLRRTIIVTGGLAAVSIPAVIVDRLWVNLHPAAAGWLYLLFVLPITLHWGRLAGLLTSIVAGLLVYVLFIAPRYTLTVQHPADLYQLLLAVASILLTVEVVSQVNRMRLKAVQRVAAQAEMEQAQHEHELLLATVAHDLRSPLAVVRGHVQLLQHKAAQARTLDVERLQSELAAIDRAAVTMAAYIGDILDLAKLQAGKPLELNCQPTDLIALARREAATFRQGTHQHPISVDAVDPDLVGRWDSTRLARVVDNLLTNAAKYSADGTPIEVRLNREDDNLGYWAVLSVRDWGLGIPEPDLPHIFERFRRGRNVAGRIPGTGLGLAGAKQIVEQHGGTIAVRSEEGKGTTITVRLPVGGKYQPSSPGA